MNVLQIKIKNLNGFDHKKLCDEDKIFTENEIYLCIPLIVGYEYLSFLYSFNYIYMCTKKKFLHVCFKK